MLAIYVKENCLPQIKNNFVPLEINRNSFNKRISLLFNQGVAGKRRAEEVARKSQKNRDNYESLTTPVV